MSDWREEVDKQQEFINLENAPYTGLFKDASFVDTRFGKMLELRFLDEGGGEKKLQTGSKRLQGLMKNVPDMTKVKIIRTGEGYDTHYEVEVLK